MDNIKTIIEVKAFGDFDIMFTHSIMVSPEELDVDKLLKEFYDLVGIESNHKVNHVLLYEITEDFVSFLELKGFSRLKTNVVYFSD